MPSGPGYWLDPRNGKLHLVITHNDWLLDPQNQKKVGLTAKQIAVLASLDPVQEIDEIRMVGVLAGLVRIRDYRNRVSVQFYVPPSGVREVLQAVVAAIPAVTRDIYPYLTIQNLFDDATARLSLSDLSAKLQAGAAILTPPAEPIPYNHDLRRKMNTLLEQDR